MLDGRFKANIEKGLRPIGLNLRKTGITADHLTTLGVVMAAAAAVAIGMGQLRVGLLLLVLTGLPDALDGAVAKASGTAGPRGAFFDSVSDRVSDSLLLGGVAWYLASTHPGHLSLLPMAVLAASLLISYQRAKADAARLRRPRRDHGTGRAGHPAGPGPAVRLAARSRSSGSCWRSRWSPRCSAS